MTSPGHARQVWASKEKIAVSQSETWKCGDCGEPCIPIRVGEEKAPCRRCGSFAKHIHLVFVDEANLTVTDFLDVQSKNVNVTGKRKIRRHLQTGSQWSVSREKFVDKVRDIDRDADTYYERVIDPETGEVLRHCEEPLSEHFGRGSAKPRSG